MSDSPLTGVLERLGCSIIGSFLFLTFFNTCSDLTEHPQSSVPSTGAEALSALRKLIQLSLLGGVQTLLVTMVSSSPKPTGTLVLLGLAQIRLSPGNLLRSPPCSSEAISSLTFTQVPRMSMGSEVSKEIPDDNLFHQQRRVSSQTVCHTWGGMVTICTMVSMGLLLNKGY